MRHYLILGGDQRQLYLSRILAQYDNAVITYCDKNDPDFSLKEAVEKSDVILCPVPFTHDKIHLFSAYAVEAIEIEALLSLLAPRQHLFGGSIPETVKEYAKAHHIPCHDYMDMPEIAIRNTVSAAEGAIAEAIALSPGCLHQSCCLVAGFGRCGKTLALKLKGMDVNVTVTDQDETELAKAASMGFHTVNTNDISTSSLLSCMDPYRYIFNTIPALVFDETLIGAMNPAVTIIDIASAPGGVDYNCCAKRNIRAKLCPGLPGIYGPQASAEILYNAIMKNQ